MSYCIYVWCWEKLFKFRQLLTVENPGYMLLAMVMVCNFCYGNGVLEHISSLLLLLSHSTDHFKLKVLSVI